ncbi:caspase family protein [Haladaptatus salinisoli]|uniref:caspase family protein n=1 Tax=Haladaptatus salinisoli TaxID=2884876 RepID=UPI001D0A0822|nr:caspase family protein [Haladaptatus salinisoli]
MSKISDVTGKSVTPRFRPRDDLPGLTILDPLERSQYTVETSRPVDPRRAPVSEFAAPVGTVASLATSRLRFRPMVAGYVRNAAADLLLTVGPETATTFPDDEYYVELSTPVKTYLRFRSAVEVDASSERLVLNFDGETTVEVGVRSRHSRPAGTVTTTADPVDVMAAISTFGSALKTTSPERSFPTLRGHPPAVELGDALRVPDDLRPPETGIRIEIPPRYESIFPVAPLAYYLGAELAPGRNPRIVTEGTAHALDHPERGFEGEVERVLKQTFLLDCVTRTEGLYRVDLHERQRVEPLVDLDFAALYDAPVAERLEAYLDVPFSTLADAVPTWRLAVYATNESENVTHLPYVLRNLPVIRTANETRATGDAMATAADIRAFARAAESDANRPAERVPEEEYVTIPDDEALERAWLGRGAPIGGNKLLRSGFENRLARERTTADIEITIVCNDSKMRAEWEAALYGNRDDLPFDVTARRNCSTEELRELLRGRTDFFHYIGHVEDGALVCSDGALDPADVDRTGANMFLLNACRSYVPGKRLVEAGSIGGIVTHSEIGNGGATVIGRTVARLLNAGFPLRAALSVARGRRLVGNQYAVVGDGSVAIAQSEGGTPYVAFVESLGDGEYAIRSRLYPTNGHSMGSTAMPFIDGVRTQFLAGGDLPTFTVSEAGLQRYLELEDVPVVYDGDLFWSSETDVSREFS